MMLCHQSRITVASVVQWSCLSWCIEPPGLILTAFNFIFGDRSMSNGPPWRGEGREGVACTIADNPCAYNNPFHMKQFQGSGLRRWRCRIEPDRGGRCCFWDERQTSKLVSLLSWPRVEPMMLCLRVRAISSWTKCIDQQNSQELAFGLTSIQPYGSEAHSSLTLSSPMPHMFVGKEHHGSKNILEVKLAGKSNKPDSNF